MLRYAMMRLLGLIPTLLLVTVFVFLFVHLLPGDPARLVAGPEADDQTVAMVRHDLGLDRPMPVQFVDFVVRAAMVFAVSGISVPPFALGILLMEVFSVQLGWFPTVGADSWLHYVLPSITLGAGVAAVMARFTRSSMMEVLDADYVRTARAKGLGERSVVMRHALRNALIPVVTMLGLQFGFLLGGSIVVEKVFNWPGIGRLLVDAVDMRDYPVMQACVLLFSLEFMLINLAVDLLYGWINPAVRFAKGGR